MLPAAPSTSHLSCHPHTHPTLVLPARSAFHISEDVFAGYNHVQRSGSVKFKEYISVGKGRDMGFDSINSFESKVCGWMGGWVRCVCVVWLGSVWARYVEQGGRAQGG